MGKPSKAFIPLWQVESYLLPRTERLYSRTRFSYRFPAYFVRTRSSIWMISSALQSYKEIEREFGFFHFKGIWVQLYSGGDTVRIFCKFQQGLRSGAAEKHGRQSGIVKSVNFQEISLTSFQKCLSNWHDQKMCRNKHLSLLYLQQMSSQSRNRL